MLRSAAATAIATGKDRDAIAILDAWLTQQPDDAEAQWLLLHALYGSIVRGGEKGNTGRFATAAQAYRGPHEALLAEWLTVVGAK